MNHYLKRSINFLLFSHLFIACCAVSQGLVTYKLLNVKPNIQVLFLLFCATLASYNLSFILSKPKNLKDSLSERVRWNFSHYPLLVTMSILSALSVIALGLFLSRPSKVLLIILALVTLCYFLPIFSAKGQKNGLRNVPGLKLILIASVWTLSCVFLPIIELQNHTLTSVMPHDTLILSIKRFLFFAAIAIPFDIRDLNQDKYFQLKTIPVLVGEKYAWLICGASLGAYLVLLLLFAQNLDGTFWGLTISIVCTGWLIFRSKWKKNEYYYSLLLDGTMILQFILLSICSSIVL